jgi:protein-tyrosine kinase
MSKIHEALKKAQQERSLGLTGYDGSLRAAVSAAPLASNDFIPQAVHTEPILPTGFDQRLVAPVVQQHSPGARSGPTKNLEPLPQFEDLLKKCAKTEWSPDTNVLVFSAAHPRGIGAEQFRTLRSRLYNLRETATLKKILITSAIAGEGKTFVASNIAQAIAREKDRRVLLIDGDLRKPRLHTVLGAPLSPGLSDCLCEEIDEVSVIQHGQEGNLYFIPGGDESAHASELLSNGRMQKLLDRLTPLFDWIIIDSPPCLPVADAGVLAGLCDGVLLVVRATHTPLAMAQKARKELQKRNVVGVVLNAVEKQGVYESYHSYGYGYGQAEPVSANDI